MNLGADNPYSNFALSNCSIVNLYYLPNYSKYEYGDLFLTLLQATSYGLSFASNLSSYFSLSTTNSCSAVNY